jgi:hypothetical protein
MEDEEFRRGAIEIQWLERRLPDLTRAAPPRQGVVRAAIAAVLLAERDRSAPRRSASESAPPGGERASGWLRAARLDGLR